MGLQDGMKEVEFLLCEVPCKHERCKNIGLVLEAARKQLPKEPNVPTSTLTEEDKQGIARALSAGFDLKAIYELGKFNEEFSSFVKFKKAWTPKEE